MACIVCQLYVVEELISRVMFCLRRPTQARELSLQTRWAQREAPGAALSEAVFRRAGAVWRSTTARTARTTRGAALLPHHLAVAAVSTWSPLWCFNVIVTRTP